MGGRKESSAINGINKHHIHRGEKTEPSTQTSDEMFSLAANEKFIRKSEK